MDGEIANIPFMTALAGALRCCKTLMWLATCRVLRLALHPASNRHKWDIGNSSIPKPDKPEPKRQHKTSVVRKIFGRSADLRPRKCSWVDQEKVCNPLGLKAFCPWRNNRRIHFDTSEFFAGNVKTELVRD